MSGHEKPPCRKPACRQTDWMSTRNALCARAADQPSAFRPESPRCVGESVDAQTFAEPRQGPVYA